MKKEEWKGQENKGGTEMGEEKIQTPSSSTGIMRFYDVSSSNIQLDARIVLGFTIAIILLEIVLGWVIK